MTLDLIRWSASRNRRVDTREPAHDREIGRCGRYNLRCRCGIVALHRKLVDEQLPLLRRYRQHMHQLSDGATVYKLAVKECCDLFVDSHRSLLSVIMFSILEVTVEG